MHIYVASIQIAFVIEHCSSENLIEIILKFYLKP